MRITGYKLVLLVSYIIIVFFNLATLFQLRDGKSSVTPAGLEPTAEAQEAERTLSSVVKHQTSPASYIINNTESEGNIKNNKSEVKDEITRNNSLYYSALPGTNNSWTLFDIRKGATKKSPELIGIRLIIVGKIQVMR